MPFLRRGDHGGEKVKEIKTTMIVIDFMEIMRNPYLPRVTIEMPEWIKPISIEVFGYKTTDVK